MYICDFFINEGYEGINPRQYGEQKCEPLHNFGPALRPFWLLHYVVSGHGMLNLHKKNWFPEPGDMFVIPPYVEVYYEADEFDPWHYTWVGFDINHIDLTIENTIYNNPQLGLVFQSMRRCRDMSNGKGPFLCSKIWEIISILTEERKYEETDYIDTTINWIHSNYMLPIRISEIAKTLHVDRSYLTFRFKEKEGISPQQYLINYRLEKALELMVKYSTSPTTTALSVGYSDVFCFSKAFKKKYGMSPRAYLNTLHESQIDAPDRR